jgi:hypothetical protein
MRLGIALVAAAALVVGCGPSIDPAAKADVDARIAKLRAETVTIPAPSAQAIESMPPAVGQWAEYKIIQHNGEPKFLTQKIVGEEDGAFLVELVHDSYRGRMVEQLLVAVGDRRDPKKVELRAVKIKNENGHLTTLSKADLWVARNHLGPVNIYWEDAMSVSLGIDWRGRPQASTAVIAGRFEGCYHSHSSAPIGLEAWSHPSVPFGGLVREQDKTGFVSELVAYGTSGAQSGL